MARLICQFYFRRVCDERFVGDVVVYLMVCTLDAGQLSDMFVIDLCLYHLSVMSVDLVICLVDSRHHPVGTISGSLCPRLV